MTQHTSLASRGPHRYRPYPGYKDFAAGWLGKVPSSWKVARTKHVTRLETGHTPSRTRPEYWTDCTIPWFTLSDVWQIRDDKKKYLSETKEMVSELGLANSSARLLPAGTVILSRTASVGFSGIMQRPMATTQDFVNWVPGPKILSEYLLYVFRGMRPELHKLTMGSTHQTIYMPDVQRFVTPLPPLPEQRTIAAFLDRETAKIDRLIEKKQRLIELLDEKRTALISHAVTKGLDPDASMKDSGVEWLLEIPEHWKVTKLKAVSSLQTGLTLGKQHESMNLETRPYLRVANVQDGYLALDDVAEIELPGGDIPRYELQPDDVIVTEGGDFDKLGRGCVWSGQIPGCLHQNHIFSIRTYRAVLNPNFLAVLMSSRYGRAYFTATSKQSTNLASTNSIKVRNFPIPLPSLSEQDTIISYAKSKGGMLDRLIRQIESGIDRLQEYRTALISAAVTGKIDVRNEADAT